MKLMRSKERAVWGFNLTPMVDVVFLLIIFFMSISQISRVSRAHLQLPVVTSTQEQEVVDLTITIDQAGQSQLNGRPFEPEEISKLIHDIQSQGRSRDRLRVRLRSDKRADSARINQIVNELSQAQIKQVSISVYKN